MTDEFLDRLDRQRAQAETDPDSMMAIEPWEEELMDFENLGPLPKTEEAAKAE